MSPIRAHTMKDYEQVGMLGQGFSVIFSCGPQRVEASSKIDV